jgi:hypothetical protein
MSSSNNHSTFHAFFLAAKEKGHAEFQLQLISSRGGLEFYIRPQGHPETSARFEVRGNTVRAAAREAGSMLTEDASGDKDINYGGPRSGEAPVWAI